jgi:hypothetical protein
MKQRLQHPVVAGISSWLVKSCLALVVFLLAFPVLAQTARQPTLRLPSPALNNIQAVLPAADLEFYQSGDIKLKFDEKFVDPSAQQHSVSFEADIGQKMPAHKVLWQVSQMPFVGPLDTPPGLLLSGTSDKRVFEIDFAEVARKAQLPDAPKKKSSVTLSPTTAVKGKVQLQPVNPQSVQPSSATASQPAKAVKLRSGMATSVARNAYVPIKRSFYVRAIPIDAKTTAASPRFVGRPSEELKVVWAAPPPAPPGIAPSTFEVVSSEPIDLRLVEFKFIPRVSIENWPKGCEPIPRDEGGFSWEKAGDFLMNAPDWVSTAYADAKKAVISVVAFLLPFVPESVISIALDAALASAGLPPSIPNLDQMIDGGADYLAVQMAAQIPTPASGALAEMAAEEARREIQKQSKAALVDTAKRLRQQQRDASKYCRPYYANPYFEITVRNASKQSIDNTWVTLSADSTLFENITLPIDRIEAGEQLTLPVAYLDKANIEVKYQSQLPDKDREKARSEWWEAFMETPMIFSLGLPTRLDCYGDGKCLGLGETALRTPKRVWFKEPAYTVKK